MSGREPSAAAVYRRLLRYLRPHWWLVVAAFVPAVDLRAARHGRAAVDERV